LAKAERGMVTFVNPLKTKLANGGAAIGTMVTMPSPHLMQLFAASGFDWLLIDREHGAIGAETMQAMINATTGSGATPLVRVPEDELWMVKTALDAGALGVFFPFIINAGQASAAVASTFYPPKGKRGFGPFYAPSRLGLSMGEYAALADDAMLRVMMIEHADAIENVDEIMQVPGIDVAFIAPFDLSQSLGVAGEFEHPKFLKAVETAERAILASPAKLGGLAPTPEKGRTMLDHGYRFLMMAFDGLIIEGAAKNWLDGLAD